MSNKASRALKSKGSWQKSREALKVRKEAREIREDLDWPPIKPPEPSDADIEEVVRRMSTVAEESLRIYERSSYSAEEMKKKGLYFYGIDMGVAPQPPKPAPPPAKVRRARKPKFTMSTVDDEESDDVQELDTGSSSLQGKTTMRRWGNLDRWKRDLLVQDEDRMEEESWRLCSGRVCKLPKRDHDQSHP